MAVIEVEHLVKQFQSVKKEKGLKGSVKALFKPERRTITAVKDISFSIEPGEIVGYIGPNGAGNFSGEGPEAGGAAAGSGIRAAYPIVLGSAAGGEL